ncbi:MAG: YgfZ/GcvT domain-containing protein, partial [Acidimicrobiia bacterium]
MQLSTPHLAPTQPELVWFGGSDAIRFLNDLISQEIGNIQPGEVRRSFLLTPQGKLDFVLWALRDADRVGLVTEDGRGEELVARLSRYQIRVDVEIEMSAVGCWLVIGPFDVESGRWSGDRSSLVADVSWATVPRALVVGEKPDLPAVEAEEYEALRIEAGEPLMGVDITDSTIPQETGLVPTSISFNKGCFLGQELVARLDSRGGRVNHHLR